MKLFNRKHVFGMSVVGVILSMLLLGCQRGSSNSQELVGGFDEMEEERYGSILGNAGYLHYDVSIYECSNDDEPVCWEYAIDLIGNNVKNLTPLRNLKVTSLLLERTMVADLSPLRGQPIHILQIYKGAPISDITPLASMPLRKLCLDDTKVTDITALMHISALRALSISNTKVSDISSLEGMHLFLLDISRTEVSDLTPLRNMPLENFAFTPSRIDRGMEVIRELETLKFISARTHVRTIAHNLEPAEFWRRYDEGEFRE